MAKTATIKRNHSVSDEEMVLECDLDRYSSTFSKSLKSGKFARGILWWGVGECLATSISDRLGPFRERVKFAWTIFGANLL